MDARSKLGALTARAMDTLDDILDASNQRHDEDYVDVARLKLQAASLLLGTATKTNELQLKARQTGAMERLLEAINREERLVTVSG